MEQIKITVNGIEMTGNKGETILTIAAKNGVEIPNLCYSPNLKLYGACGYRFGRACRPDSYGIRARNSHFVQACRKA